eukprot:4219609-Pleurochrysis_carterae.AAC.1
MTSASRPSPLNSAWRVDGEPGVYGWIFGKFSDLAGDRDMRVEISVAGTKAAVALLKERGSSPHALTNALQLKAARRNHANSANNRLDIHMSQLRLSPNSDAAGKSMGGGSERGKRPRTSPVKSTSDGKRPRSSDSPVNAAGSNLAGRLQRAYNSRGAEGLSEKVLAIVSNSGNGSVILSTPSIINAIANEKNVANQLRTMGLITMKTANKKPPSPHSASSSSANTKPKAASSKSMNA